MNLGGFESEPTAVSGGFYYNSDENEFYFWDEMWNEEKNNKKNEKKTTKNSLEDKSMDNKD